MILNFVKANGSHLLNSRDSLTYLSLVKVTLRFIVSFAFTKIASNLLNPSPVQVAGVAKYTDCISLEG